jgi:DNA-binding transcriptional LysR family regulator
MNKALNALCPILVQFAAVAREGQITRAADALGVPQPTVTRHLARLEGVLGVRLYTRGPGGVTLTADGEMLLEPVGRVLALLLGGVSRLEAAGPGERRVSLAFLHTLGEETVPSLLREFGEIAPHATFSLIQDSANGLLRRLADGEVELCLTSPLPDDPALNVVRLGVQRLVLAVPEHHDLAREPATALAAAASEDFVTLEPHNHMRNMADALCQAVGFEPHITFEASGVSTLRGLVAAGLGVAIVPAAPSPAAGVVEVPLADKGAYREIGLAWRRDISLPGLAEEFRRFVVDRFGSEPFTVRDGIEAGGTQGEQDR